MSGPKLRHGRCGSCREPVYWVHTDNGEWMPIDVEPVIGGNLLLAAGETPPRVSVVSKGGRPPGARLYLSHFKTCRFAKEHRKSRPPAAPRPVPPVSEPSATLFSEVDR